MYTGSDNTEVETNYGRNDDSTNHHEPTWKVKEQRRRFRQKIFGDHYNYNYRKPNQHKMYRIQENRNTEIERENRILLEKIQGIFKRSMGKKKAVNLQLQQTESEETHDFVRENIVRARTRRSTESVNQKNPPTRNPEEIGRSFERSKRIQTEMQMQKHGKIHPEELSRITKKRQQTEQPQLPTKRKRKEMQEVGHKVVLYKGEESIGKTPFMFTIFVEGPIYSIIAEQENAQVQEQINIPYEDYKKLHKKYLQQNHAAILDYLHINLETGLLELVGFESSMMDIVQYGEVQMQDRTHKNTTILPSMKTPEKKIYGTKSEVRYIQQQLPVQSYERPQNQKLVQSRQKKDSSRSKATCQLSNNLINLQILPREADNQDKLSSIHQSASNTQTVSMLPMFDGTSHEQDPQEI